MLRTCSGPYTLNQGPEYQCCRPAQYPPGHPVTLLARTAVRACQVFVPSPPSLSMPEYRLMPPRDTMHPSEVGDRNWSLCEETILSLIAAKVKMTANACVWPGTRKSPTFDIPPTARGRTRRAPLQSLHCLHWLLRPRCRISPAIVSSDVLEAAARMV